jgi:hypothetical protein
MYRIKQHFKKYTYIIDHHQPLAIEPTIERNDLNLSFTFELHAA